MDFKAKDLLDFKPTLFEEALKTTIEWYDKEFVSQYDYRHSFSKGSSRICDNTDYVMIDRLVQQALPIGQTCLCLCCARYSALQF